MLLLTHRLLVNGTGNQGDVYLVEGAAVGGTSFNFGAGGILFFNGDQAIYSGSIWQRASGATGTVTSVAITESGDSLNITGSPIVNAGTINIGFNGTNLQYVNGAGNLTTFPILTGYVPYTGATANVDLGVYDLTADLITGATGSFASSGGSDTFAINHSSGGGIALNITKGGNGEGLYINKTSGSGNAATIVGTLEATTLVKNGGTSSQFLKADGTVDSNTYALDSLVVHLAGTETITGAKTFSGYTTFTSTVDITSGLTFSNSGFTLLLQPPTLSVNRTVTLPNATGTLALTSDIPSITGLVPYTGATANVDLGGFNITAGGITAGGTSSFVAATLTSNLWLKNTGSYDFIISNNTSLTTNVVKAYYTTNDELRFYAKNTAGASVVPKIMVGDGATFTQLQSTITLTTTGTSGAATLVGATLNIPQYQAAGTYVTSVTASAPLSSSGSTNPNITITQVSSTVDGYLSFSDYNVFSGKISGSGTAGYITRYTGSGSTIGNSGLYDDGTTVSLISRALSGSSASFGSSVTATSFVKTSGTSSQYLMADGSVSTLTNPVTGTGTTNYLPKFTGASTIGNSIVQDDATTVTVGGQLYVNRNDSNVIKVARNGGSDLNTVIEFANATTSVHIGSNGTLFGLGGTTGSIAAQPFIIVPSSSEKMRLDTSGNLGLGVTPSAWRSTERALQIGATTSVTDISNFAVFRNNNYVNSSGQEIYITTNGASALVLAPTSEYRFLQAAAGTAGAAITFTQAMTLTAAGRLLLGTTTESTYLLDVNGTGRFSDDLTISKTTANLRLFITNTTATTGRSWYFNSYSNGNLYAGNTTAGDIFNFSSTGAATFSGNVTVSKSSNSGSGNDFPRLQVENTLATQGDGSSTFNFADVRIASGSNSVQMFLATTYAAGTWAPAGIINVSTNHDLQIKTNNTTRLTIASTGAATFSSSVTAGSSTSSGYATLNLIDSGTGSARYASIRKNYDSPFDLRIRASNSESAAPIVFDLSNAVEAMRITSGGNVGIGTVSPNVILEVGGLVADVTKTVFRSSLAAAPTAYYNDITAIYSGASAQANKLQINYANGYTSGTGIVLQGDGNVGIGTASPNARLSLGTGTTSKLLVYDGGFTGSGGNGFFAGFAVDYPSGNDFGMFAHNNGALVFGKYTNNNDLNNVTERMRITSTGEVGIGSIFDEPYALSDKLRIKGGAIQVMGGDVDSVRYRTLISSPLNFRHFYIDVSGNSANQVKAYFGKNINGVETDFMTLNDGNVLIGTTDDGSGSKLLSYSTTAATQFKAAGTAPAITFSNTITSATIGGSLGACTSANQFLSGTAAGDMILINQFTGNKLYITNYSGGVYLTQGATSWTANSDIRLKNINSHIENAVEKLSTLQTINFSYKDDKTNKQNLGLIAQEVEKIFPELIDKNGDGMLGVRYTELVPVLIKAVQELKLEIETLKNK
jgi:hypothetical protein